MEKSTADYEVVQTSLKEVESITVDVKEADGVGHHTIEIKATHDSTKADQIVAPEQFDAQVQNEPKTLHQHHAATLGRLGRHADDNGAALARLDLVVQERMAALASDHSSNHNAAMRDLQALDQQLKQQMAALGDSHDDILAKALSEHRELTAEELRELASTHDDHKSGIDSRFNEHQDALRKELERFGNEHQSTRDELLAGLGDLKSEYQKLLARLAIDHTDSHNALRDSLDSRLSNLDRAMLAERDLRDGHHSSLQDSLRTLEAALRKELAGISANGQTENQRALEQAIRTLEVQLQQELRNLDGKHKQQHSKFSELFDQHKSACEKQLQSHRAAHDQHGSETKKAMGALPTIRGMGYTSLRLVGGFLQWPQ